MSARRRAAYLDCTTGVSGDKLLGALLDAGETGGEFTTEHLRALTASLAPEAEVEVERVLTAGVSALSVRVTAGLDRPHRRWSDIRALIGGAAQLRDPVRAAALRAFEKLAGVEARIHGVDADDVHFHEVGAIDSIVDVVGVCAGLDALGVIDALVVGPVAVGSGSVDSSHGILPVPAPATAALLQGIPVASGPAGGELTTPTGAALVATLGRGFGAMPSMVVGRIGYGAGTRDIGMPNICRVMIGEAGADGLGTSDAMIEPVVVLEANIDHLTPEALAFAAEELFALGALDVWQTPIVMKKGRSAVALSALVTVEDTDALAERFITLTGSLGVRRTLTERLVAPREIRGVATRWGTGHVKVGAGLVRPEHEDIARIARESGLPYAEVAEEIARAASGPAAK